jgi:hypothetical protein
MKNPEIPDDQLQQFKRDMEHHQEESMHVIQPKDKDDWLAEIHEKFVAEVTETEVPLWMANLYGQIAFGEPPEHKNLMFE